jgi:hypothetical protein
MHSIGFKFAQVRIALSAGAAGLAISAAVPALLHGRSGSDTLKAAVKADSIRSTAQ